MEMHPHIMDAPDTIDTELGARIKALRGQMRLTIDQLAAASGVSRAMISRIERGESSATAQLLNRLCSGLGVSLSTLFATLITPMDQAQRRATYPNPTPTTLKKRIILCCDGTLQDGVIKKHRCFLVL